MAAADYYTQVYTMFVGYFGRPPAQSGLDYYANLVNAAGGKLNAVLDDFHKAPESQALFAGKSVEQQVNIIFQNLFGRDAAPAGLNYWTGEIIAGRLALSQAAYAIAQGAQTADQGVLTSKVNSAKAWVASLDTTNEILSFSSEAGRAAGREFLKTVTTSTPATQTAVDAAIKAMVDGGTVNPGQTFTLTTGVDNLTGTAGNDTFIGGTAQIQAADVIDGGAGTDTAKLYLDTAGAGLNASNVEIFQIQASGGARAFNATNVAGAEQIWSAGSTSALTINGLKNNVTLGLDKTQSDLLANFVAGTIGAAETLKLATDSSGTAGARVTVTVNDGGAASKFTTLDVNAVAGKSFINIADLNGGVNAANETVDFTTLKTSGAGTVNLAAAGGANAAFNNLTTLELNAAGGSTVNLGGNAKAVKVTGSDANDTVIFAANEFNTQDVIDLGAGTNTLVLGNADLTGAATTELTKAINAAKGVTTLATSAVADVTINAARYSAIDSFAVGLGGAVVGTNGAAANGAAGNAGTAGVSVSGVAASGDSLNIQNNLTGGNGTAGANGANSGGAGAAGLLVRMALDSGTDTFSLSVSENNAAVVGGKGEAAGGNGGNAGAAGVGIDAREVETLNITVSKNLTVDAGATGNGAAATADVLVGGNATLNISGTGNVDLGRVQANSNDTAFQNLSIKAGDLVGSLTVVTGAGNDVIIVGSKGSDVTAGAGQDTITLGAGQDVLNFNGGDSGATVTATSITGIDVITGFKAGLGGDLLNELAGGVVRAYDALTANQQTTVTNAGDLKAATDTALAATDNSAWTAFTFGGKTYAVYDTDDTFDAVNGIIVELVGVTVADLVGVNFA